MLRKVLTPAASTRESRPMEPTLFLSLHQNVDLFDQAFCRLFIEALNDLTLIILAIAAVASIIINTIMEEEHRSTAWIEGFAILLAVLVSSLVQAINNFQKEKQFQKLNEEAEGKKTINIIRDGLEKPYKLSECLVGDLVVIKGGDEIAGDGIIVNAFSVGADESAMTGEPDVLDKCHIDDCIKRRDKVKAEIEKHTGAHKIHEVPSPVCVSGTCFQMGSGTMLITCIGMESAMGQIKKTITDNADDETPLQKKLEKIAEDIGKFGLVCAIFTCLIMIIRAVVEYATRKGDAKKWTSDDTRIIIQAFLIAITVLVVAIPEGLPLAVTLSLAYSVKKMLKDNNLVRKLHACETMGGADIICSDKTGTLTKNKMFMTHFWNQEDHSVYGDNSQDFKSFVHENFHTVFRQIMTCNSEDDPTQDSGNATDLAILKYMLGCGVNAVQERALYERIHVEPLTSDRKRMSTLIQDGSKKILLIKGASELVSNTCDSFLDLKGGQVSPITDDIREKIKDTITAYAKEALRTITVGFKEVDSFDNSDKDPKSGVLGAEKDGFTFVGICGIKDPIRDEVPGSVNICMKAGIQVKMVTGDNPVTARAIAKECAIIDPNEPDDDTSGRVMQGRDFIELVGGVEKKPAEKKGDPPVETIKNGAQFDKIYKRIAVLARSRPADKYAMVTGLRERGHVVAVTGDGTNDAPALSKASVGFAMGITGTEVAKQAAAIMLMDDNFTSIVKAVKWGRNIYDSIRKFIQFQLTVNVVAVVITFLSAAVTQEAILSSVQMLWVNMIMDTLASLALATETPSDDLLLRKPNRADDYIISKKMAKHILGQSVLQLVVMLIFLFLGPGFLPDEITDEDYLVRITDGGTRFCANGMHKLKIYDSKWPESNDIKPSRHFTYNFNVFVVMQIFNFVNARKINDELNIFKGICSSLFFPVIVIMIIILQVIIVTLGDRAFRVTWLVGSSNLRVLDTRDGLSALPSASSPGLGLSS